jgi:hypothetical protein
MRSNKTSTRPLTGQAKYEQQWLEEEMANFRPFQSEAWFFLTQLYGPKISKDEIVSLGRVTAEELKIELVREYKRRKETMVKWFQNHIDRVRPFLSDSVQVLGENGDVLGPTRTPDLPHS